jgi:hypothetical protein
MAKGIMVVASSPAEGREDEYNEWYNQEHIPALLSVPGFVSARRFRVRGDTDGHKYLAIYELEADDLAAPVADSRNRDTPDRVRGAEVLGTDPPAHVTIYEQID